jgi:hypothetical protein
MLTLEQIKEKYGAWFAKFHNAFINQNLISFITEANGGVRIQLIFNLSDFREIESGEYFQVQALVKEKPLIWAKRITELEGGGVKFEKIYTRKEQPKSVPTEEANTNEC